MGPQRAPPSREACDEANGRELVRRVRLAVAAIGTSDRKLLERSIVSLARAGRTVLKSSLFPMVLPLSHGRHTSARFTAISAVCTATMSAKEDKRHVNRLNVGVGQCVCVGAVHVTDRPAYACGKGSS